MPLNIITNSDRTAVDALRNQPVIQYPVYHWVKHHTTDGYVITQPEDVPTYDFDEFLSALESLSYSHSMKSLALPTARKVDLQLGIESMILESEFSKIQRSLLGKKRNVLLGKALPNHAALITEINELLRLAKETLEAGQEDIKNKRASLHRVMPDLKNQSTLEVTETRQMGLK